MLTLVSEYCPATARNCRGISSQWVLGIELWPISSIIVGFISPSHYVKCVTVLYENGQNNRRLVWRSKSNNDLMRKTVTHTKWKGCSFTSLSKIGVIICQYSLIIANIHTKKVGK